MLLSLSATVAQATVVTYSFGGVFSAPTRSSIGGASDEPLFRDLIAMLLLAGLSGLAALRRPA